MITFFEDFGAAGKLWIKSTGLLFVPPYHFRIIFRQCEVIGLRSLPVVLVSALAFGTITLLCNVLNAFTDPAVGYLSDREFQLGCYSTAVMVTAQLYGLGNMLAMVTGPRYAESYGRWGDRRAVARLAARAKVGNFVEVKNTELGEGSKASHLSYVGDAEVGREVNIGANNHHANWFECIRTRQAPSADAELGHRAASLGHLTIIAYRLQRSLKWDPVKERITNNEKANDLLHYEYRAPWKL